MGLKEKAKALKVMVPAVYLAMKRSDTPLLAKFVGGITVIYALSPIDLIPDFIPILGYLDDVLILPALVALTVKLIPKDIMTECQQQAQGIWQDKKPKKWYYMLPILLIWVILIVWIFNLIF